MNKIILNKKIGEILGLKVKFKNQETKRKKSGIIRQISEEYAFVTDNAYISRRSFPVGCM